jgi:putative SOS response-associated peptidase YedK
MSGFYEWQWLDPKGKKKLRHFIRLQDPATYACAGLWNDWKNPEGQMVKSFTIITCPANRLMAKIHNPPGKPPRMPVILTGEKASAWIDGAGSFSKDEALAFLKPISDEEMLAYPVENNAKGVSLIKPIGEPVTV